MNIHQFLARMDWKMRAIHDGRGFHFNIGALSTPIVGGGNGTVIDQNQPEGVIKIPAGYMIAPLRIHIVGVVPALATDLDECEILIAADVAALGSVDGTWANTVTPKNMHSGRGNASACTVKTVCSADCTNPTLGMELAHLQVTGDVQGTPATALWTPLDLLYEPVAPPILFGPAGLYIYWGGTVAVNAFAHLQYLEFESG